MNARPTAGPMPHGWRETALGELVARGSGLQTGPFGNQLHADEYVARGVPVVMPRDLRGGSIRREGLAQVSEAKARDLSRHRLRPGDLVLARRGQVGRCALVGPEEKGWICGTGCVRVRLDRRADPGFLLQYLSWDVMASWFRENAVGQTMANLSTKILAQTPLRLPPLEQQRRIRHTLERVARARVAQLEVMERTELLGRRLLEQALATSIEPDPTSLEAGWVARRLGQICRLTNGYRFKASDWADTGLPILRIQNLNGATNFKKFAGYARPSWIVHPGDVLFAWSGARSSLGPHRWNGPEGVLNQHIFHVRPLEGVDKDWLLETLRALMPVLGAKTQGFKSTLVHIRKGDLVNLTIALPPAHIQQRIGSWSRRLEATRAAEQEHLDRQAILRSALCDALLTGRVRPPS